MSNEIKFLKCMGLLYCTDKLVKCKLVKFTKYETCAKLNTSHIVYMRGSRISESFVRGVPTLTFFFLCFNLMMGGRIQIPLLAGHQQPASETAFKWRFVGGPMMA